MKRVWFIVKPAMRRCFFAAFCLAILLTGLPIAWPAAAAELRQTPTVTMEAEAGYDGYIKVGTWVPIRVTIESAEPVSGEVVVTMPRQGGIRYAAPVSLSSNAPRRLDLYVPPSNDPLEVQFVSDGRVLASTLPTLRTLSRQDRIVLAVGDPPDGFNFLNDLPTPFGGKTHLAQAPIDRLPDHTAALNSVDAIVFSNADTTTLSKAQQSALQAWVVGGGHLIINGGPGALLTLNGLGDLAPAQASSALIVTSIDNVVDFLRPDSVEPLSELPPGAEVQALRLVPAAPDGQTLIASRDSPLVIRRELGRGLIDQLAFDVTLSPLRDWASRPALFTSLMGGRVDMPNSIGQLSDEYSAKAAARDLPTATLPSIFVVAGFLALYVLFLGPINFFLLRKIKRPELAWITIPVAVVAFTLLGLATGFRLRGNEPQIHRLSLINGDARVPAAPAQAIVGVFAPRRMTLDFPIGNGLVREVEPDTPTAGGITLQLGAPNHLRDVAAYNSDVRAFYAQTEAGLSGIQADLRFTPGQAPSTSAVIAGEIANNTGESLRDCALISGRDYQSIGDLPINGRSRAEVKLLYNRPQSLINFAHDPLAGATYAMPGNAGRRLASPESHTPIVYRGPFDVAGATPVEAIMGWRVAEDDADDDDVLVKAEYDLLTAFWGAPGSQVGHGVNLACWRQSDSTGAEVAGANHMDHSLHIWRLPVRSYLAETGATLPPDIFAWSLRSTTSGARQGEGGLSLEPGQHVFGFAPWFGVRTTSNVSLTLAFEFGSGTRLGDLRDTALSVYDWQAREFIKVVPQATSTGSEVTVAGALVSPAGSVRVRLDNPAGQVTLSNLQVGFKTP